ncbi:alpha/beta fold hydrolase [Comamonas composti]|uniref:alpha/beta fold hydrolase n=1 Tax=Comamonas composti TaxID=408558 RepID=UPI000424579C|nr:alpha/beta fold hydrolase [Comamonas composti]
MPSPIYHDLPQGIRLHCRASGQSGQPLLVFLHGFPQASFIWEELLEQFGPHYRCLAPDLRGYGHSSQPTDLGSYRAHLLVDDLAALIRAESPDAPAACVIAHDWGGALAWGLANQHPELLQRLLILNAPHPGSFLRELQHNPAQQAASQYMHFLRRPDAPALLAENGYQRMLGFFANPRGELPDWLTPELAQRYRDHWSLGLHGACHYYGATPLVPPRPGEASPAIQTLELPARLLEIKTPTKILWGMNDPALSPALLQGLEQWIAQLQVQHLDGVSHWVLQEQPEAVSAALHDFLQQSY